MQAKSIPNKTFHCDCCGANMYAHACKISCPNCGFRFDCSDLTLNFDPQLNTTLPDLNNFYGKQTSPSK